MQRCQPFGVARGPGGDGTDDQSVAVFHERMVHETEFGLFAPPLTVETGVGISRGGVRLIAPLLAMEVLLTIGIVNLTTIETDSGNSSSLQCSRAQCSDCIRGGKRLKIAPPAITAS
jgi:hypothetical protein